MADAAKVLTPVDNQFISSLNDDILYQAWMDLTVDTDTKSKCLLVVISKNKIYFITKTMFNGRKIQVEEALCRLTSLTVRGLNNNYMITLEGKQIKVINLLPPDELICEHITLTLLGCLQRFKSCTILDVKTKEDIPEDFRGKFEVALPTNVEICTFAYKFFCIDRGIQFEPQVVSNISRMFKTDSTTFSLNRAISGATVQPNHFDHIIGALGKVKCFTTLEVDGLNMSNNTHIVGWLFAKNQSFNNLILTSCRIGKSALKNLLEPMKNLTLNILNLGYNPLRDQGIVSNKQLFARMSVNELYLNNCEFRDSGMDTLGMIFQGAKWNRRNPIGLTALNLAGNKFGKKGVVNLQDYLLEAVCLRELSLVKCDTDLTPILSAISENKDLAKNMRRLNFSHNRLKADSAKALGKVLTQVEALRFLFLSQCNLDANLLKPILVALAQNEIVEVDLNLSLNGLQNVLAPLMQKLKDSWQSCLSGLIVEDCELSVEDIKSICEVLCEKNKTLKLISFDLNFKTNKKNLNIPATGAIGKLIAQTEVEILSITGNKPNRKRSLTGGEMRPIFDALQGKNKLTNLYIQGNRIGMEGLQYLKGSLAKNMTLQVIDLEDNKIDQKMAFAILELARPGPLTALLPMQALNRLKQEMNAKSKAQLKEKFSVARGILKQNQQKLAKTRHERGVSIKGSNRTSVLRNAKAVQLSLSHEVKNAHLSSKLFSDGDLDAFKGSQVGDEDDGFIKIQSSAENVEFMVKREANVKDATGKVKGQLQAGAKVTGELSTKRRIMKKSIKTSAVDIYEIHLIKPVDGWIQFHTYKGDVILEEVIQQVSTDLFDEGFHTFLAKIAPGGLEVEGSSLVVRDIVPGSQLAEHCEVGDILVKIEDDDVTDPVAALEAFKEATWPMNLTFSRPNTRLVARTSVVMKPKSPTSKKKIPTRQGSLLGKKPKAPPKREAGSKADLEDASEEEDPKRDPSVVPQESNKTGSDEEEEVLPKEDDSKPLVVVEKKEEVKKEAVAKKEEESASKGEEPKAAKEGVKKEEEPAAKEEAKKEEEKPKAKKKKLALAIDPSKLKPGAKAPQKSGSSSAVKSASSTSVDSEPATDTGKKEELKKEEPSKSEEPKKSEGPKKEEEPQKAEEAKKVEEAKKEGAEEVKKESSTEEPKKDDMKKLKSKKKIGGGLAARMAMLNQSKGAGNLAMGGKGAPPKRLKKKGGGKIGALAGSLGGIPMPGMGGHPGLKKKAKQRAEEQAAAPKSPVSLEKATITGKRKRRKKKPKLGLDGM